MPIVAQDDYADAGRRHLADAHGLAGAERWDGVMHLAGFAGECALKASLLRSYGGAFSGRDYRHDLEGLAGWAWAWSADVLGDTGLRHARRDVKASDLAQGHPDRRYWRRCWTQLEAEYALALADQLVHQLVLDEVLDRGAAWGED